MDAGDLKLSFNLNLKICHYKRINSQKCIIPVELFASVLKPGALVICATTAGNNRSKYLCRVFPMKRKNIKYCELDDSVSFDGSQNPPSYPSELNHLSRIDIIPAINRVVQPEFVTIRVTIKRMLRITKTQLENVIKNILQSYYLINSCSIKLDDEKSFGITEICITGSDIMSVFTVGRGTELKIEDVHFRNTTTNLKWTHLKGLDGIYSTLVRIKNEFEELLHAGNCKWQLKPSFNTLIISLPGAGKTSICYNFILEFNCNLFQIKSSDIIKSHPGETENCLAEIFENAEKFVNDFKPKQLTIILIEDVDLLCPIEMNEDNGAHKYRISRQLLTLLDGIYKRRTKLLVIGTTSHIDSLDSAIRRPGRFENEISILHPDEQVRCDIIKFYLTPLSSSISNENIQKLIEFVAANTSGYMGSDLVLLIEYTFRNLRNLTPGNALYEIIKQKFQYALTKIVPTSLRSTELITNLKGHSLFNIGGMDKLKKLLEVSILAPLKYQESYKRFAIQCPKGILLYGPPGCAKTSIVKCLATDAKMRLISVSPAEVYSAYVGNSEKFISKIFSLGRKNSPCIIFFDEIDALIGNREIGSSNDLQSRILSVLLTEMDGIGAKIQTSSTSAENSITLVMAATNRPDLIDGALLRPGRFDKLIHVPAPDRLARLELLRLFKNQFHFDANIDEIAEQTGNFSGADLCNLYSEAALMALSKDINTKSIKSENFEEVLKHLKPSLTENQIKWYFDFEQNRIS